MSVQPFDIIIKDIRRLGFNAYDLVRQLRAMGTRAEKLFGIGFAEMVMDCDSVNAAHLFCDLWHISKSLETFPLVIEAFRKQEKHSVANFITQRIMKLIENKIQFPKSQWHNIKDMERILAEDVANQPSVISAANLEFLMKKSRKVPSDPSTFAIKNSTGTNYAQELFEAAKSANLERIEILLEEEDINGKDQLSHGYTALIWATGMGHREVVDLLIKRGADVNGRSDYDYTALMSASWLGFSDLVELFISNGALVDARDKGGWTSLMKAAGRGHRNIVELLLKNGADVEAKSHFGDNALIWAARINNIPIVTLLLKYGANINAQDHDGWTPLMKASWNGHVKMITMLLFRHSSNVLLNLENKNGYTALDWAVENGHQSVANLLTVRGAKLGSKKSTS